MSSLDGRLRQIQPLLESEQYADALRLLDDALTSALVDRGTYGTAPPMACAYPDETAPVSLALNLKGQCLLHLNRLSEALAVLDEAVKLNSRNDGAWMTRGHVLRLLAAPNERIIENFAEALSYNDHNGEAWCYKGNAHGANADYLDALYCFRKAMILGYGGRVALFGIAQCKAALVHYGAEHEAFLECHNKGATLAMKVNS